jgi:hypothetical protein
LFFAAVSHIVPVQPILSGSHVVAIVDVTSQNHGITTAPEESDLDAVPSPSATVAQVVATPAVTPVVPTTAVTQVVPTTTTAVTQVVPTTTTAVTYVAAGPLANPVPTPSNLPYIDSQSSRWYTVTRGIDVGVFASWCVPHLRLIAFHINISPSTG